MSNLIAAVDTGKSIPWGTGSVESKFPTISTIINMLLKNSLVIAGVIFIGILIFGGFRLIMSAGSNDPKQTAQAQATLTHGIIGLAVVFCAFLIIQVISKITGFDILNPTFN